MVHIAVETDPALRGTDAIHETPPDTYDNVVKENVTVETPESVVPELARVVEVARTPPRGPVRIGIPKNFLRQDVPLVGSAAALSDTATDVPSAAIDEAAELLAAADRPLIVAGGGIRVSGASDELRSVAETLDAPVVPTYKGKGVFPEDHGLFAGIFSVGSSEHLYACMEEADAVLGVGTDFDAVTTQQWAVDLTPNLVHVTLQPSDLGTGYDPKVGIVADAKAVLAMLDDRLDIVSTDAASGASRAATVRDGDRSLMADVLAVDTPPLTSASAIAAVRRALPPEAVVSVDAGGFRIWALHVMAMPEAGDFVDTGSWATMGTGVPAAVGAKLANPDRDVLALTGGGGLLMCMQELHTAATEGIPITVVVLNNDDYATISAEAAANYGFEEGAFSWADRSAAFAPLAESLGVEARTATTPDEVESAVADALVTDAPTLVEVPSDPREPQAKPLD